MIDFLLMAMAIAGLLSHFYGCYLWAWRGETQEAIMCVLSGMVIMNGVTSV